MKQVNFQPFRPSDKPGMNELFVDYIHDFMHIPQIWDSFDDATRRGTAVHMIVAEWLSGSLMMGVPMVNGEPIGLFWSRRMNKRMVEGFQSIHPGKTMYSWGALDAACNAVFSAPEYVDVRYIAGFIDVNNRKSAVVARHSGFKKSAILPGYFTVNGQQNDAIMMIKEK